MDELQQIQNQQQLLRYGFIALIVLILIVFFLNYFFGKGKKVKKMGDPVYFDNAIKKELNKNINGADELLLYTSIHWRNILNLPNNYYLGLTNKKLILVKVKSYLYNFMDTDDNTVLVNHNYEHIKNLSIKESRLLEWVDKTWLIYPIKRIKFMVDGKKFDLKIKYKDVLQNDVPLNEIEELLMKKIK